MPCSPVKVNELFGGTYHLSHHFRRVSQARNQHETLFSADIVIVSCVAYNSTLKIEKIYSSVTSVHFHQSTWHYELTSLTVKFPQGRHVGIQFNRNFKIISEVHLEFRFHKSIGSNLFCGHTQAKAEPHIMITLNTISG
jgi:hypothetical protein